MASDLSQLSIHTITNKPWSGSRCIQEYARAGVKGITFWRYNFDTESPAALGKMAINAGLTVTGLARAGFFPAFSEEDRKKAIEENFRAIDEAHDCGAPVLVLVCGAVIGMPLPDARNQIADGIHACVSHARKADVKLAIEPLHPMYAADRSAIVTMGQANDVCDWIGSPPEVGIAMDVYHTWWDENLESEILRAGKAGRLFSHHICDWKSPDDLLNDRALMGEGCIDLKQIEAWMNTAQFQGFQEVEIFSNRWWAADQLEYLQKIVAAYQRIKDPAWRMS